MCGPYTIVFWHPCQVAVLVQMRAVSRITIAPMVETLPCVGGVSVTLLEAPYFDAAFRLINSIDILSMPGIHDAVQFAAKVRLRNDTCGNGPPKHVLP